MDSEHEAEKNRRMYYQNIVYYVCQILDQIDRNKLGINNILCGTFETPCDQVQKRMDKLLASFKPNQAVEEHNRLVALQNKGIE